MVAIDHSFLRSDFRVEKNRPLRREKNVFHRLQRNLFPKLNATLMQIQVCTIFITKILNVLERLHHVLDISREITCFNLLYHNMISTEKNFFFVMFLAYVSKSYYGSQPMKADFTSTTSPYEDFEEGFVGYHFFSTSILFQISSDGRKYFELL